MNRKAHHAYAVLRCQQFLERGEKEICSCCSAAYGLAISVVSENVPRMQSGVEIFCRRSSQYSSFPAVALQQR